MTMPLPSDSGGTTAINAEAIGAFGHDVRSPLNAIIMLIDVARRISGSNDVVLDEELTRMLLTSVDDIVRIVGELQEVSRLERGKTSLRIADSSLEIVLGQARELASGEVDLQVQAPGAFPEGTWDEERLAVAIAELARAANRSGGAPGFAELTVQSNGGTVQMALRCGVESGEVRNVDATLGWPYFRGMALLRSMGGTVTSRRQRGFMEIEITLPSNSANCASVA